MEETVFYPELIALGRRGDEEAADAINDHNQIRDAVRRARHEQPGSDGWWEAVLSARASNSDHMAEEERGAIPDFRLHAEAGRREQLGAAWTEFEQRHPGAEGLDESDKDADAYISEHG